MKINYKNYKVIKIIRNQNDGWLFSARIATPVTFQMVTLLGTIHLNMKKHILACNFVGFIRSFTFEDYNDFNNNKKFCLRPMDLENISFNGKQTSNIKFLSNISQSLLITNCKQQIENIKINGSFSTLNNSIRIKNMDKLVAGNFNINALETKFDELKALIIG